MKNEFWFKRDGATLLHTTPSSSNTLRYQSRASSGMGMYARSLLPAMRQPKLNWAKALSSAAASCVATKKYSLYMGLVWSDQAPIEDGVLHIEQGPLVGQEARVRKIDRHKRWCLVDVGEGDSAFRELLPLEVPSKT